MEMIANFIYQKEGYTSASTTSTCIKESKSRWVSRLRLSTGSQIHMNSRFIFCRRKYYDAIALTKVFRVRRPIEDPPGDHIELRILLRKPLWHEKYSRADVVD